MKLSSLNRMSLILVKEKMRPNFKKEKKVATTKGIEGPISPDPMLR